MSPASKLEILKDRAQMMQAARSFFEKRGVMEVDTPVLGKAAPIDLHIDAMTVSPLGYLHTSPEYAMKRLLSLGIGDIYQLSHVFREGEIGRLHNPEFTMLEWYRVGISFQTLIEETLDLIHLFIGKAPAETLTYREAFQIYAGIDYFTASPADLLACAQSHGLSLPADAPSWDKSTLLHFILGFVIEPHFQALTVLRDYPASESALARIFVRNDGEPTAHRFEIYFKGIELANGFEELTDPIEQRHRFEKDNVERVARGKSPYPIDEKFLEALEHGLPDCCGVAVGFDRLMLLRHQAQSLNDILPFAWNEI